MAALKAVKAWAVSLDPSGLIEMSEEYGPDALEFLNENLAKGDFQVLTRNTQGYEGDMIIDFPVSGGESYRALVLLEK